MTKNTVRIIAEEGYEITVFNIRGADIEVVIVSKDGTEAARLLVQAPKPHEMLRVHKASDGSVVDFVYEALFSDLGHGHDG